MEFNRSLVETESQLAREQEVLAALDGFELTPENAGKLPASIARSDEIRETLGRWMSAYTECEALKTRYTAKHPEVEARERMVQLYRSQCLATIQRARTTTAANVELLRKQATSLRARKTEQSALATDLELQIVERRTRLGALERSRDAIDQSYRGILSRISEARLAADENTASVKIVENAVMPEKPVRPNPVRLMALALILGLGLGFVLALVTDELEDRVGDLDDIEGGLGVKVMGVIPHVKSRNRNEVVKAMVAHPADQVTEAFAGLRAVLDTGVHKGNAQVVMVVSSLPEEGKTITACNLAMAWARKGQRVLLVDFDLRRPRIASVVGMPDTAAGLLDCLTTKSDHPFSEWAYAAQIPNLWVIGNRAMEGSNPVDIVGSPRVGALMAWARATYDHVVIDTPPLGSVSDALVLAAYCDHVLIVTRPGVSRRRLTAYTVRRLVDVGVHHMGAIINDVNFSRGHYYAYGPYGHYAPSGSQPPETPSAR